MVGGLAPGFVADEDDLQPPGIELGEVGMRDLHVCNAAEHSEMMYHWLLVVPSLVWQARRTQTWPWSYGLLPLCRGPIVDALALALVIWFVALVSRTHCRCSCFSLI